MAPMMATSCASPITTPARRPSIQAPTRPGRLGLRAASGRRRSLLERTGPQDARDLLAVERLPLEQRGGERVQLLQVGLDHVPGPRRALQHDALDLGVDQDRGVLAVVLGPRHLPTEEDVLLALAEGQRAHAIRHAPLADHLAGHLGGLLEVVARPRRLLLEDDLLRGAAAEEDRDAVDEVVARVVVLVVGRELLGEAERPRSEE